MQSGSAVSRRADRGNSVDFEMIPSESRRKARIVPASCWDYPRGIPGTARDHPGTPARKSFRFRDHMKKDCLAGRTKAPMQAFNALGSRLAGEGYHIVTLAQSL